MSIENTLQNIRHETEHVTMRRFIATTHGNIDKGDVRIYDALTGDDLALIHLRRGKELNFHLAEHLIQAIELLVNNGELTL